MFVCYTISHDGRLGSHDISICNGCSKVCRLCQCQTQQRLTVRVPGLPDVGPSEVAQDPWREVLENLLVAQLLKKLSKYLLYLSSHTSDMKSCVFWVMTPSSPVHKFTDVSERPAAYISA
jgi:hypothetical protein